MANEYRPSVHVRPIPHKTTIKISNGFCQRQGKSFQVAGCFPVLLKEGGTGKHRLISSGQETAHSVGRFKNRCRFIKRFEIQSNGSDCAINWHLLQQTLHPKLLVIHARTVILLRCFFHIEEGATSFDTKVRECGDVLTFSRFRNVISRKWAVRKSRGCNCWKRLLALLASFSTKDLQYPMVTVSK